MDMTKMKHLITKTLVCAIVLLICITVRANTAEYAPTEDVSITLDLPDVMFTCQRPSYLRLIIENKSENPYRFWNNALYVFSSGWLYLDIDNIEGNALEGQGGSGVTSLNKWYEGKYDVIEPGDTFARVYFVNSLILSTDETGIARVRLQFRDRDTGKMVTLNEEIVKVRKLEDAEREVVAEKGRLTIERVKANNENTELIMLSRGNEDRLMHLFGIPPEAEIELAGTKSIVHILATSNSGIQRYIRIVAGIDVLGSEKYTDGKKRTLKKLPDGSVELEVVGGDGKNAEESDESDPAAPESMDKTNSDASSSKSPSNTSTPRDSQSAAAKQPDPKTGRSPLSVAIIASLAVLFLGIALFIVRQLFARNSS